MPNPTPFESLLPIPLQGMLKDVDVYEALPTNISQNIRTSENWGVSVSWEMNGAAANLFFLDPERWHIRLKLESIGIGADYDLPVGTPLKINYSAGTQFGANVRQWNNVNLSVPAGTVQAGVYKMALTIQLHDPLPAETARPVVGFIEGMLVNFYD